MKIRVIFSLALLVNLSIVSRSAAESPFSALGYGLLNDASSIRSAGMGFTSLVSLDLITIDLHTSALWAGPATARLSLQGGITRSLTSDEAGTDISDLSSFSGVAMAIPLGPGRFFGVAVSPYTRMGYRWDRTKTTEVNPDWNPIRERMQGRGGLTQGLIGFSSALRESGRIGLGIRTIFGKIDKLWKLQFPDIAQANSASLTRSDRFIGIGVSISGIWQVSDRWLTGISINSPVSVKVQNRTFVMEGNSSILDTTFEIDQNYDLPFDLKIGAGRSFGRHSIGLEAAWHGWNSVENPVVLTDAFEDAVRISGGWEFDPVFSPFDPFWRSFTYRGGFYVQQHYAKSSSGHRAARVAFTSGFGLPYNFGRSRIDIAMEAGWMGSEQKDGAFERFGSLKIGFNHSELWFIRGKRGH